MAAPACCALALAPEDAQPDYPLTLNTGRVRDQWHTMTRTGRVPRLMTHIAGPRLALNPSDAARRGIADDGLARIESAHGSAVLRVSFDAAMRAGDVFVPMHWTDQFSSAGPVDRLVHAVTDPVSGQPDLKGTRVEVAAIAEAWRGLLLRCAPGDPALGESVHWSKAPIAAGFAYEMSGWTPLADLIRSEQALRNLLQAPEGAELVSYSDPKKSVFRYAAVADGRLAACVFFAAPRAGFAEAGQASHLLGRALAPIARLSLLAGLDAGSAPNGRIICSCFSVGETAICGAIRAHRLTTPAQIGALLGAGTNCGSCIPELARLLAAHTGPLVGGGVT